MSQKQSITNRERPANRRRSAALNFDEEGHRCRVRAEEFAPGCVGYLPPLSGLGIKRDGGA
jgi:hypothetical protein